MAQQHGAVTHFREYPQIDAASRSKNPRLRISEAAADEITRAYREFSCAVSCLTKYRIDYILYGPQEKKIAKVDLRSDDRLVLVAAFNGVEIYKVRDQKLATRQYP